MDFIESELKKKTVDELRAIAEKRDIDLADIVFKSDIIAAILEDQVSAGEEAEPETPKGQAPKIVTPPNPLLKGNSKGPSKGALKLDEELKNKSKKRHASWV